MYNRAESRVEVVVICLLTGIIGFDIKTTQAHTRPIRTPSVLAVIDIYIGVEIMPSQQNYNRKGPKPVLPERVEGHPLFHGIRTASLDLSIELAVQIFKQRLWDTGGALSDWIKGYPGC